MEIKKTRYESLRRLKSVAWRDSGRIALGLSALAVNSLTNLTFPWLMEKAVDQIAQDETRGLYLIGGAAGLFCIGSVASWVRVYSLGTSTDSIANSLRKDLYNSCLDKDLDFFDDAKIGELIILLDKDVPNASEALTEKISAGLRSLNSSINGSILLFLTSPKLCAVSLALVPIVGIGAMTMSKYSKKIAEKTRALEETITSFAVERFNNISTVKLNGCEDLEKRTYSKYADDCYQLSRSSHFAKGAFMSFINMSTNTSLLAVLFVGGNMLAKKEITAGGLTKFAIQSAFVGLGFSGLSTFYSDFNRSIDSASRIFHFIDSNSTKPSIKNLDPTPLKLMTQPEIKMSEVDFAYPNRPDVHILRNFSLTLAPCSISAIIGGSGKGKSTVVSLLSGLYKTNGGTIKMGGLDIHDIDTRVFRQIIGVVEQKTSLFSGTIEDNIMYGNEGGSEEEMKRAADLAFAGDFISSFPLGYKTQVGTGGSLLSGGQRTRIALARALVKNPMYLLLDEVTSSLDAESEAKVLASLKGLSKQKTIAIFTHSKTVMKAADIVHVVVDGSVLESGSYDELATKIDGYLSFT